MNKELDNILKLRDLLKERIGATLLPNDEKALMDNIMQSLEDNAIQRDAFGLNPILMKRQTALIAV